MEGGPVAAGARAWLRDAQAEICDTITRWEHGTVMRSSRYPTYWAYNLVTVEGDPALSCDDLIAFADSALADREHRRIDFDEEAPARRLRPEFTAAGWRSTRLVWMHHEHQPELEPAFDVAEVPYEAVHGLRVAWYDEDFPGRRIGSFLDDAREVAQRRGVRVFAVQEAAGPVGFSQLQRSADGAEVALVYVLPEHRGRGIGTAVTLAAVGAGREARDLWIVADDEDRPKELYARLGFRSAWRMTEFLRLPQSP
jgi:ribosomal protein S18 acetylase RimI-like enzyme